jgi:hypothetical protein
MQAIQSSRRCSSVAQANTKLETAIAATKICARLPSLNATVRPAKSMNSFSPARRCWRIGCARFTSMAACRS